MSPDFAYENKGSFVTDLSPLLGIAVLATLSASEMEVQDTNFSYEPLHSVVAISYIGIFLFICTLNETVQTVAPLLQLLKRQRARPVLQ